MYKVKIEKAVREVEIEKHHTQPQQQKDISLLEMLLVIPSLMILLTTAVAVAVEQQQEGWSHESHSREAVFLLAASLSLPVDARSNRLIGSILLLLTHQNSRPRDRLGTR